MNTSRLSIVARTAALVGAAAATFALVSPATAADREVRRVAKPMTKAEAAANPNVRVCVQGTVTGSRIERKTCKTRQEWIDMTGIDPLVD